MNNASDIDTNRRKAQFYNLTIVFHYLKREQVIVNDSARNNNKFIYLRRDRTTLDDSVGESDIRKLLNGRRPFETFENFRTRAESFKAIIFGVASLDAQHYDIAHLAFFLRPSWNVEYASLIREYVGTAHLCIHVEPDEAETLFENERALLIFADLTAVADNARIDQLYLQTKEGKRYIIRKVYPGETSWRFDVEGDIGGYGLHLIAGANQ